MAYEEPGLTKKSPKRGDKRQDDSKVDLAETKKLAR